jgi:hypothetical protein
LRRQGGPPGFGIIRLDFLRANHCWGSEVNEVIDVELGGLWCDPCTVPHLVHTLVSCHSPTWSVEPHLKRKDPHAAPDFLYCTVGDNLLARSHFLSCAISLLCQAAILHNCGKLTYEPGRGGGECKWLENSPITWPAGEHSSTSWHPRKSRITF